MEYDYDKDTYLEEPDEDYESNEDNELNKEDESEDDYKK